jgi:hypothetical protein
MAVTVTVPPSTTKLIALADLKAILGITDGANDTLLGNIIWLARQRDPSVTMESVPDVYTVQYGGQGKNGTPIGAIPPNVQELLLPYKEFKL